MRSSSRIGWFRSCALILLVILAVSILHAAVPHGAGQRECATCKALSAPGTAVASKDPGQPVDGRPGIATLSPGGPLWAATRSLKPLRAPPSAV